MKNPDVSLSLLAENKKVIPIYFRNGEVWHTSVKLPELVIHNSSPDTAFVIKGISLEAGKKVIKLWQDGNEIRDAVGATNQLLNKLMNPPINQWRSYNLHILFGNVPLTQKPYNDSIQLMPKSVTCLPLNDIFCFHYAGKEKVSGIVCQIQLASAEKEILVELPIPLTLYHCKGNYIFPIKGTATITGTPWNHGLGHRMASSQEFAFDVVDFLRDQNGEFILSSPPASDRVDDYFLFEREVSAIGDGIVAATGNQWPNEWVENPNAYSEERVIELTQKLLKEEVEFNHAILGNYVIIDHRNGEFSLYAHMSQNTLTVKIGDAVTQGQVIGKVGNTSNSDFPHLHFQLMDSENFQTANGLPVMFSNLPSGKAPLYDFLESNSLLYSDYLFVFTSL